MESILGEGTFGEVHKALDSQTNKKVAIKIFDNLDETLPEIEEDYAVISTHWIHPNIPHFMGLFLKVRMRHTGSLPKIVCFSGHPRYPPGWYNSGVK